MDHPHLRGTTILVVEDEALVAFVIVQALEEAGAKAMMTTTVRQAEALVERDGLSAAIMDHGLGDGDSTRLCARLRQRGIPYLTYSGYQPSPGSDAPHLTKPVGMDVLLGAVESLLVGRATRVA